MDVPDNFPDDPYADKVEGWLEAIANGVSCRALARKKNNPKSASTIRYYLLRRWPAQYARAREAQADYYAERIIDEALTGKDAALIRVRVDALKWTASKLRPKAYGERLDLTSSDGSLTPKPNAEQIEARVADILEAAAQRKRIEDENRGDQ